MKTILLSSSLVLIILALTSKRLDASTITLEATNRGWYEVGGFSNGFSAMNNFITGDCCRSVEADFRNWFKFDLTNVTSEITSANLLLDNDLFFSNSESETYALFDVTASNTENLGLNSIAIWIDLGSGTSYGSHVATNADNRATVSIALSNNGLIDMNSARGSHFAIGGAVTTLDGIPDDEELFGQTFNFPFRTRLEITTADTVPVPETAAPLLIGIGLSFLAMVRRNRFGC